MSNATRLVAAVAGVGALLWASGSSPTAEPRYADPVRDYAVSGPYTHDNLSIFLLHGPDTLPPRPVKTLDEALVAGTAVVHETGTVNTLCVENLSSDDDLMMQNGDILKGGKQDRVLQVAMILPPKSGRVAVPAFCVEAGRWTNRGGEAVGHFAANPGQIAGKALKNAVNTAGVQGEVWKTVAAQQAALSDKVGKPVNGAASPSSLQLAMEDKGLQAKLAGYRAALANTLDGKKWVVGYAIAVNGKVTGAEVFGSGVLLTKAWPKAVQAAAVEALSEKQDKAAFAAVTEDAVTAFLTDAGRRQEADEQVAGEQPTRVSDPRAVVINDINAIGNGGGPVGWNPMAGGFTSDLNVPATVNPTLTGRTASTRSALVTSQGGGQSRQAENRNLEAFGEAHLPAVAVTLESPAVLNPQPQAAVSAPPVRVNRTAGKNGVMVESRDRANPGVVIHRTFIAK